MWLHLNLHMVCGLLLCGPKAKLKSQYCKQKKEELVLGHLPSLGPICSFYVKKPFWFWCTLKYSYRLSHEWQAYISRTHSLRKTFISVKGIYYQVITYGTFLWSLHLDTFCYVIAPCNSKQFMILSCNTGWSSRTKDHLVNSSCSSASINWWCWLQCDA